MTFKCTIKIEPEENWYVATCLENSIASQGKTIDEAMVNLKEAISLYMEKIFMLFQCTILLQKEH